MPVYYSLLVPGGLALFAAIVGVAALLWERHRAKQAAERTAQRKAAFS
jgi:hypothetical protein